MKLLFFINSMAAGGAERVTANLANYWAGRGWEITVVTMAPVVVDFYQLHPAVRRISLGVARNSSNFVAGLFNNFYRAWILRRLLKKMRPDVALSMMSTANVLLALARIGLKKTVVVGSERTYPPKIPLGFFWEGLRSKLYGRLDAVVALNYESAAWLRQHTWAKRISIIPNAALWPLPTQEPIKPLPMNKGQHVLLAVGRLGVEKGFHLLIDVFEHLREDFPTWRLVILGDGPERQALELQVSKAGLSKRIFLPGKAGNIGHWYEMADLYVLSSSFEGFPNTLVEAMAHGLPAVSFDCDTGPRDIIRHEIDGVLVPAGDVEGLAEALRRVMGNESFRQNLGVRAIDARERFSQERIAGMWERLFAELR